jgi:DNA-binding CsgD family transcriptional regulator
MNSAPPIRRLPTAHSGKQPTRVTTERFNSLISSLYEAATDEMLWPRVLQEVVRFCGNSGAHLFLIDPASGLVNKDAYFGMPGILMSEYDSGHILQCPRVANATKHPERTLVFDYQHIDEKGIDNSEYYQWLQSKGDGIRYYLAGRLSLLHGKGGFISLAFRKQEGHSQCCHRERLLAILPHLNRSLQISQRLGTWQFGAITRPDALGQLDSGIVILNESGYIVYANEITEALARDTSLLSLVGGRLRLINSDWDQLLQANIAACWTILRREATPMTRSVECVAPDLRRYRVAPALLLSRSGQYRIGARLVLVTITRLSGPTPARDVLRLLDRLSPAEMRLTRELANGTAIAAAARKLYISIHTARTHLKRIYAKTDTHRLSQLILLTLRDRTYPNE